MERRRNILRHRDLPKRTAVKLGYDRGSYNVRLEQDGQEPHLGRFGVKFDSDDELELVASYAAARAVRDRFIKSYLDGTEPHANVSFHVAATVYRFKPLDDMDADGSSEQ